MDGEFLKYLDEAVGHANAAVFSYALERPASVSVRLNPFKSALQSPVAEPYDGARFPGSDDSGQVPAGRGREEPLTVDALGRLFGCGVARVPWSPYGYLLDRRPDFTLDPLFHCGAYYVQDSSAMFVGEAFRRVLDSDQCGRSAVGADAACGKRRASSERCIRVLDLCAAPGGKTTDLAASLRERFGDRFLLVANEVMADRAAVLSDNVGRWGDPCVMVTSADPNAFAALPGFFDIVLADVPCSGEGMFRKDASAVQQWSPKNVEMCAARQRRILADVWPALKEGGVLIYSTCTFNRFENDGNVEWMLANLGCESYMLDFKEEGFSIGALDMPASPDSGAFRVMRTGTGFCLVPGFVPGEGQFCAAVRKSGAYGVYSEEIGGSGAYGGRSEAVRRPDSYVGRSEVVRGSGGISTHSEAGRHMAGSTEPLARGCAGWLCESARVEFVQTGGVLSAVPQTIAADVRTVRSAVRTLRAGCSLGTIREAGAHGSGAGVKGKDVARRDAFRSASGRKSVSGGTDIVPSEDLALSLMLGRGAFPMVEVDRATALEFLHGDSFRLPDAPLGHLILSYMSLPVGFVKNLGTRCNNLHPAGRRIRMDIK